MIRFLADENLNYHIVVGLRRRCPDVDLVRIQELGLDGLKDPDVLELAASEKRILLSHDVNTMVGYARQRLQSGLPMPGLIVIREEMEVGTAIENLVFVAGCSFDDEFNGQVRYLPLI